MQIRDLNRRGAVVFSAVALWWLPAATLQTEAQVPAEFTNLYAELQTDITNFEATLDANWDGLQTGCSMGAVLMPATSEGRGWGTAGDASTDTNFLNDVVVPYLNGLQTMGVKSVKFALQFPDLYQPYYAATNGANDPAGFTNAFNFYTNLCALLRERGIKIIIPVGDLVDPGATVANYETNLTFAQFVAGRSALNQTVAKYLKPDYLLLQSEPDTEANNLPPNLGNQFTNAAADMNMISNFLSDLQAAGLRSTNMIVGAGCGTWQQDFTNFLTGFTNLAGLDLLSIHLYQITVHTNSGINNLQRVLQMADTAHGTNALHPHGMRVGISECWLKKVSAAEEQINILGGDTFNGRNVYSCFAPWTGNFICAWSRRNTMNGWTFLLPFGRNIISAIWTTTRCSRMCSRSSILTGPPIKSALLYKIPTRPWFCRRSRPASKRPPPKATLSIFKPVPPSCGSRITAPGRSAWVGHPWRSSSLRSKILTCAEPTGR
jgi:hypothetical protein